MKLYLRLATEIERSIRSGQLRSGDRLPSVRQASVAHGVSHATVFQAYYLLESRGLVRARERSGYFVTPFDAAPRARAGPSAAPPESDEAQAPQMLQVLGTMMRRELVPFGSPFPHGSLFPLQRLGKDMATAATRLTSCEILEMSSGKEALRRQIAARYAAEGMHVHADEIVITNGALEALNLCLAAVARPGDTVLVESPSFYGALQALERLQVRPVWIKTHPLEGVDLDALAEAIERHKPAACWLMPTFQNPLGATMPEKSKRLLVALLARHKVPLIEDDVYGELYFGARRPLPAKAFDRRGLVLHCSSFSKSLAPGYRIGWAAPGRFAKAVAAQKLTTTISSSAAAQLGLARYLQTRGYDLHLRRLRETLRRQYLQVATAVKRFFPAGTRVSAPEGGYFCWVELPKESDALELYRRAVASGISIAPGPLFSGDSMYAGCVRINFGHPVDARALAALRQLGRIAAELR